MSDEDALLAAIAEHPAEDTPRLMYADWLEEHGEHIRAEFIRVQIEIARADNLSQSEQSRAAPANVRERVLSAVYRGELLGPLTVAERAVDVYFHRGFISLVRLSVEAFFTHSHLLAQLRPLARVRVTGVAGAVAEFLRHPRLDLVTEIAAYPAYRGSHGGIPDEGEIVAGVNRLTRLAVLDLDNCGVGDWFCALLGNFKLPALEVLSLSRNMLTDTGVFDLANTEHLHKLRRLILSGNAIGDAGAIALAERWPRGAADRLEYLGLRDSAVGFDGTDALVARFGGRVEVSTAGEW
jgi:uncharacterized protein (TIGR02996 family)